MAAIGMVVGAGWTGARAMTATSGPGISLMAEFVGLAFYAEVPAVIWDIQRVGPSTGLPTRTGQGDILSVYYLSHGDTRHVVLFPSTPKECFEFAGTAFDLAERLQTPVFVLSDLDLGMNTWISEPFDYPDKPMDRGKIVSAEQIKELGSKWGRYMDIDGDGIPYRSLPGNENPMSAYLARGTGHNEYGVYSERPEDWERNMARIARKFETARTLTPKPEIIECDDKTRRHHQPGQQPRGRAGSARPLEQAGHRHGLPATARPAHRPGSARFRGRLRQRLRRRDEPGRPVAHHSAHRYAGTRHEPEVGGQKQRMAADRPLDYARDYQPNWEENAS